MKYKERKKILFKLEKNVDKILAVVKCEVNTIFILDLNIVRIKVHLTSFSLV